MTMYVMRFILMTLNGIINSIMTLYVITVGVARLIVVTHNLTTYTVCNND